MDAMLASGPSIQMVRWRAYYAVKDELALKARMADEAASAAERAVQHPKGR